MAIRKHSEHVEAVRRVHGDKLRVVGTYKKAWENIDYECPDHGVFSASPANVVHRKSGCMLCRNENISKRCRKSDEKYKQEALNFGVTALEEYVTAHTKILHQCKDGHIWKTSPNQILSGYLCPLCDNSQYKRRKIQVGDRQIFVQGGEGAAIKELLSEGIEPEDIAFSRSEGLPTFRYDFGERKGRVYIPDFYIKPKNQVVEVKSDATLGIYDAKLLGQVQAKSISVLVAGYDFRLMVIYRGRNIEIGIDWIDMSHEEFYKEFRRITHELDARYHLGRKRCSKSGRHGNASGALLKKP